jgi:hypothetical protein
MTAAAGAPVPCLLDVELPRSLDRLLARAARERPGRIEAWVFEDEPARREAERSLAALGVQARLRSAYKPLLHAFLEGEVVVPAGTRHVSIGVAPQVLQRLKVEAYPLAALLGDAALGFEAEPGLAPTQARVRIDGGAALPLLLIPMDERLAPRAWLRCWQGGALVEDAVLADCDYRGSFDAAMAAVAAHPWPDAPPFFEQLRIDVTIGGIERPLAYGEEQASTREALHEELYFSILEFFKHRAGLPANDRTLQPGQIIPDVRPGDGPTRVCVHLCRPQPLPPSTAPTPRPWLPAPDLAQQDTPLPPEAAQAWMAQLDGERFGSTSWQGRPVPGVHRRGPRPGIVITAGQHANESSGVVGALRAAQALQVRPEAHYAVVAMENPDGAALHQALAQVHPSHMQHAARYTARGDDLEWRGGTANPDLGEKAARQDAIARTGAGLHFSLHGYPAHEWTRPFAGYLPPGFEDWALPRGFFLILRQHPGWDGRAFLEALTAGLAQDPALREFNATQQRLWRAHWRDEEQLLLNGIPCRIQQDERSTVPFTLITEFPDETVYGPAFRLAHDTQTRAVLLGAELYWQGLLGAPAATLAA